MFVGVLITAELRLIRPRVKDISVQKRKHSIMVGVNQKDKS
jgi:hypothetical protein